MKPEKLSIMAWFAAMGVCLSACGKLAGFELISGDPLDGANPPDSGSPSGGDAGPTGRRYDCVWSKDLGADQGQDLGGIAVDADGNVWLTGGYVGKLQLDGLPPLADAAAGSHNLFIAKLAGADGTPLRSLASIAYGSNAQIGAGIATHEGAVFVGGTADGKLDLGFPCVAESMMTGSDLFVAKLTTDGACTNIRLHALDSGEDQATAIAVDAQAGDVVVVGTSANATTMLVRGTPLDFGTSDSALAYPMASTTGQTIHPNAIASHDGKTFIAGNFNGILSGVYSTNSNGEDAFALRLEVNGTKTPAWAQHHDGPGGDQSIAAMALGTSSSTDALFVTGRFNSSLDMHVSAQAPLNANGGDDVFIASLKVEDGSTLWSKAFGTDNDQSGRAVAFDPIEGAVLVAGNYRNEINLGGDPLKNSDDADHIFLARFDAQSNHQWSSTFSVSGKHSVQSMAMEKSDVVIAGTYTGSLDFGCASPLVNNNALPKVFVARLKPAGF